MSRLIDADELLKEFDPDGERLDPIFVRSRIVQQTTAFDTEKVVAELKDNCDIYSVKYYQENVDVKAVQIDDAIDIVRKGGIK